MTWPTPSSHICGSWYLSIFLFRDGSLTLISMASLMVLVMLWSSLATMLKFSSDTSWPVVFKWSCIGDDDFMCSLNLFSNCSAWLPYVLIFTVLPCHTYICKSPHSSLICYPCLFGELGAPWWYWILWKNISMPVLSAHVPAAFTQTFHIGHHYVRFILDVIVLIVFILIGSVIMFVGKFCPIQSSCWVLAVIEGPIKVTVFLLQQLVIGTDCPGSVS